MNEIPFLIPCDSFSFDFPTLAFRDPECATTFDGEYSHTFNIKVRSGQVVFIQGRV
jgi:hypothetical protein